MQAFITADFTFSLASLDFISLQHNFLPNEHFSQEQAEENNENSSSKKN